jgi:multiple sugar transport system ATP-binding protein
MAEIVLKNVSKTLSPEKISIESTFFHLSKGYYTAIYDKEKTPEKEYYTEAKKFFKLENINLVIPDGKTTVLLGPSGCGKTTLLKLIAGLIKPDCGVIEYDGVDVSNITPKDRGIGIVFENYALYPGFEAEKNILSRFIFSEKLDSFVKKERLKETAQLLGVDIKQLLGRFPKNLSGGERQRVALGRCITRDPKLFLLDEPLSNLDANLRERYRIELKKLLRKFKITTVYVTHNQEEAIFLGDRIVVMNEGKIIQEGNFDELFNRPVNTFVAEFINPYGELPSIVLFDGSEISERFNKYLVGVRPDDFILDENSPSILAEVFLARLSVSSGNQIIGLRYKENEFFVYLKEKSLLKRGDKLSFHFRKLFLFDKNSGCLVDLI